MFLKDENNLSNPVLLSEKFLKRKSKNLRLKMVIETNWHMIIVPFSENSDRKHIQIPFQKFCHINNSAIISDGSLQ